LRVGEEGYITHSSLNFYKGIFYVKIFSHQSDSLTISAIRALATKISGALNNENQKATIAEIFPKDGKILHSEKYIPTNYLGYGFLNNAVSADYSVDGKKFTVFTIQSASSQQALEVLQKYLDFSKVNDQAAEKKYSKSKIFSTGQCVCWYNRNVYPVQSDLRILTRFRRFNQNFSKILS
jgi:hypothetical protein